MVPDEFIERFADFEIDPGDGAIPDIVVEASQRIAAVYVDLLANGVGDEMVARAMMGATVSFYDAIGLSAVLPTLLRIVADKVESELARPH